MDRTYDIGVDLDGVLYPFDQYIAEEARVAGIGTVPAQPVARTWHFYRAWGITDQQFLTLYSDAVRDGRLLWEGAPYPGSREGWDALRAAGHRLHVLTDRRPPGAETHAHAATLAWLTEHGFEPDTITITPDKTQILTLARHPQRVAFLDDRPENHAALTAAGVTSFLMDRPWNTEAPGPRVPDLPAFATVLNNLLLRV